MRRLAGVLAGVALAAGALVAVGEVPAGGAIGDGHPLLRIDAVVNGGGGYPTGSLQIRRTCVGAGNATNGDSSLFTVSTPDMINAGGFLSSAQSCTVSALSSGGMNVSFVCQTADASLIACSPSKDTVMWIKDDNTVETASRTATITVTFNPPPVPALQVTRSVAVAGETVTISGTGCILDKTNTPGDVTGTVEFTPPLPFGPVTAAADGTWSTTIVVPPGTPPGAYAVNATCTLPPSRDGEVSAQAAGTFQYAPGTLTITIPAAIAVPAAPKFTG